LLDEAYSTELKPLRVFALRGSDIAPITRQILYFGFALVVGVALTVIGSTRRFLVRVVKALPLAPRRWTEFLESAIESFASGLKSVHDPVAVGFVTFFTFLNWAVVAFSVWMLKFGFVGLEGMAWGDGLAVMVLICFAVILPAGPAYFGMYEAGGVFALLVLGLTSDHSLALSFTLAMHLLQILPIIFLGLLFVFMDHISIREIREDVGGAR